MYDKSDKNIDKNIFNQLMKEKLEEYKAPVDEKCWEEIQLRLQPPAKKKTIPLWTWFSGAAVAIAIILIVMPPLGRMENNLVVDNVAAPMLKPITGDDTVVADVYENTEEAVTNIIATPSNQKNVIIAASYVKKESVPHKNEEKEVVASSSSTPDLINYDIAVEENQEIIVVGTDTETSSELKEESVSPKKDTDILPENPYKDWKSPKKKKESNWQIAMNMGSGGNLNSNAVEKIPLKNNSMVGFDEQSGFDKNHVKSETLSKYSEEHFSDVVHYPAISAGLTVRKDFNRYLALESGLVYSYLYSEYENKGVERREANLKMHYLGIPLNGVVYAINGTRWNLYASIGAMVEKGIWSSYSKTVYLGDKPESKTESEAIDGLQWSLNASIGLSYRFIDNFSFYLEPKVTCYLDNNQPLSARTQNPFSVGLNAGLRYTIN